MESSPHRPAILYRTLEEDLTPVLPCTVRQRLGCQKITTTKPSEPSEGLISAIEPVTEPSEASGGSMRAI